jgi:cytochrome c6
MKTGIGGIALLVMSFMLAASAGADASKKGGINGAEEFQKHCAVCHPNGGNTMKPEKTLRKKDLTTNGVKNAADIVKLMRKPGPGMTPFDRKAIDDREAKAIAEYILKTFK